MALPSGTKLGPYEILTPLGAGGMGEVYRARDARLNRDVAVKILPATFARDPERLRRFQQEAQAVAALSHPNILAVHDFGEHEGSPYLVTECLEGETLRDRMRSGILPLRKANEYGEQVARGLAAAHEKGIVHRDLKPENIFLTRDGRVKILDFGLAKLTQPDGSVLSDAATMASQTGPGVVMGTVGYMSPEQVKGQTADHRSDLFSLGTILYEMLSGKRAFHGDSSVETMSAILKQDPPELTETNRAVPPALERIVRHCLEKNPDERFQSASDIAFNLANLSEISGNSSALRAIKEPRRWFALLPVVTGLLLALVVAGLWFWPRHELTVAPVFHRLTYDLGTVNSARFSPDGHTVVYSAAWEGQPSQIFSTRAEFPLPQPMVPGGRIASISGANEIAFLVAKGENFAELDATLNRVPLSGGSPREVLSHVRDAAWGPDGSLAVVHIVNGRDRLEYPLGKVLYETAGWISQPHFSRQGDKLAFLEHTAAPDTRGTVAIVDLNGHKQTLTKEWEDLRGLAWSAGGDEIWFAASDNGSGDQLRAVTPSGRLRTVFTVPIGLILEDIATDGRVLVASVDVRYRVSARAAGTAVERDLSWYDYTLLHDLSADGQKVLLVEQGVMGGPNYSVGIRAMDGSAPIRLGEGYGGDFSPDGKWAITFVSGPPPKITILPTGAGEPRDVPIPGIERINSYNQGFFPDGKRIWFSGAEAGHSARTYAQPITGGAPQPITPEGIFADGVSPDGKLVIAPDPDGRLALFPIDGSASRLVPGINPGQRFVQWSEDGKSIYVRGNAMPISVSKVDLSSGKQSPFLHLMPADPSGVAGVNNVVLSRDAKTYAYNYRRLLSELIVVEGLK
jgi:serine/threonine protein kinase/Tol biopolymer transport system component